MSLGMSTHFLGKIYPKFTRKYSRQIRLLDFSNLNIFNPVTVWDDFCYDDIIP